MYVKFYTRKACKNIDVHSIPDSFHKIQLLEPQIITTAQTFLLSYPNFN